MTKRITRLSLIATALALVAGSSTLFAQTEITLNEAIDIAEAETGGVAVAAEWEIENGVRLVEIDDATGSGEIELTIDPLTGAVLSTEIDDEDDRDDDDEDEAGEGVGDTDEDGS